MSARSRLRSQLGSEGKERLFQARGWQETYNSR